MVEENLKSRAMGFEGNDTSARGRWLTSFGASETFGEDAQCTATPVLLRLLFNTPTCGFEATHASSGERWRLSMSLSDGRS